MALNFSTVIKSFVWATKISVHHGLKIVVSPVFWIGFIAAVLIGVFVLSRTKKSGVLEGIIIYIICSWAQVYIVVLGYGGPTYMPNRTELCFINSIVIWMYVFTAILASNLATIFGVTQKKMLGYQWLGYLL